MHVGHLLRCTNTTYNPWNACGTCVYSTLIIYNYHKVLANTLECNSYTHTGVGVIKASLMESIGNTQVLTVQWLFLLMTVHNMMLLNQLS